MEGQTAWLVDAAYDAGRVTLTLIRTDDLHQIKWSAPNFRPYYLVEAEPSKEVISKLDLFTEKERALAKVEYSKTPPKKAKGWEIDISPTLSFAYDNGLRFGVVHQFRDNHWIPEAPLTEQDQARFNNLVAAIRKKDPLKLSILTETYKNAVQPVPTVGPRTLGLPEEGWSEEEYHRAMLLSRLTNLPLRITYRKFAVSEWIRSMLHNYYRAHNILVPNSDEMRLGSDKKYVTGALTIAPASGTYFGMIVLDFESLYAGVADVYNLSYETIRCPDEECRDNLVPGLDYHVCRKRRGIYSAILGALRELRLHHFKPMSKTLLEDSADLRIAKGASQALKLLLNASYGVTVRIHGLASPLLGEAITAYGRHVLQTSFDLAREKGLKPKYGDTDSLFLDNPQEDLVVEFIEDVKEKLSLELAHDRKYDVCVLSNAMKAYFGILPNGEPEIKGLTVAKSNSPRFFLNTFQDCLKILSNGRGSLGEWEQAKKQIQSVVSQSLDRLRKGRVPIEDLAYKVELRDDPLEKSRARTIPQAYQAAILLIERGGRMDRRAEVEFVKVHPFKHQGRHFTVRPVSDANINELNIDDYVRNLTSSLRQTFEPMGINLRPKMETELQDFS